LIAYEKKPRIILQHEFKKNKSNVIAVLKNEADHLQDGFTT